MSPLALRAALETVLEVLQDSKLHPSVARSIAKVRVEKLLAHVGEYVVESSHDRRIRQQ